MNVAYVPRAFRSAASEIRIGSVLLGTIALLAALSSESRAQDLSPLPDSLLRNELRLLAERGFYSVSTDIPLPSDDLTGAPCGSFRSGSGDGYRVLLELDHDLRPGIGVSLGASLFNWNSLVSFPCQEEADIRMPDGSVESAETEFVRRSDGLGIGFGVGGYVRLAEVFRLSAGLSISGVLSSEAEYTEEVRTPSGAVFENGQGERPVSGIVDPAHLQLMDLELGAEYRLRAGDRLWLLPHVRGRIPIVRSGADGSSMVQVFVGLGVGYRFDIFGWTPSSPLDPGLQ